MATYLREDEVFGTRKPVQYLSDAEVFGETPVASPASAPLAGTMAGFEPVEAVTPVTPPAPVEEGPILPPQASLASLGRRVAEPAEPLRSPEETVTPMTVQPAPEPVKPAEPTPYRSRAEALDDAVNLLEEGADKNQVIEGFKKLGIEWPEIVSHGQKRGSNLFRPRTTEPGQLPEPRGEMRKIEPTFLESTANTFKRADANLKDLSTSLLFSTGALSPDDAAQLIRRQARQRGAAAPSEEIQQGLEAIGGAKTYGDAAEAMLRNPRATLSLLVDSLLVTAPALAATALAGPARPAAAFAASASMEYAAVMGDVLQDKGIDLTDASKVAGALQNPEILAEMKEKGAKRGLIIGTFDAISMGMAGRFLRPANELIAAGKLSGAAAKKATIAAWSKELALQMGTGAGGEFAAQQATGENKPAEVLLEGIAEGVTAPVDVAAALRQAQSSTREAQIARAIEEGVEDTDFTREGIRREGAAAAAGIRPTTIAELARTLPVAPPEGPGEPSVGAVTPPSDRAEPSLGAEPAAAVAAEPQIVTAPTVAPGRAEPRLGPPSAPPPSPPSEPPTPPTPAPVTPVTRPVEAIPGMPTGEEVEELEATPVTPAVKPPDEPATPAAPIAAFTTAKGSTYEVTPEGQTIRTKRSAGKGQGETYPPHTALYVQPGDHMEILSDLQGGMGDNAVRLGYVADNKFVPIQTIADLPENAQPTVGVFNRKTGAVVNLYKADTTPAEGLHPVEKLYTPDGQSSTHIGNQIVSVQRVTPVTLTEEVTKPVTEVTPEVTPVTPAEAPAPATFAARSGTFAVSDAITPDGPQPEQVKLVVRPDGSAFVQRGEDILDVTPMVKAGFTSERVIAQTLGDDTTGKNVQLVAPEEPKAPAFKPTKAAESLPETPTVAPEKAPKLFEPTPVNMESEGLPTVEVPLADLSLSKDVPQFKVGASEKGVVEPLGGKFERTGVAPIQVWRRLDGTLEVISGRHRFDLAQRSGEKTIPAQIHDEAKGFGQLQAAILDAELNIRDGQGKVKDYVNYFKESGIDRETADARGLLARATGKRSFTIANQGSDELVAAVRADQIGDEAAYYVALNAPGDARLQSVGIKAIMDGKSMNTATNMMQAVKALAGETDTTLDMFGFDDSAIREAEEMAKIASQKQREIQTRLSAISGAAKNPAVAKAEGIDIRDPEAVKRRIEELKQRKAAWDNWSTSPDLVAEIRAARGVEPPAPTIVEPPAEAPAEAPSLFGEDLLTAPTPEDLRAKEEAAARRAREAAEAERRARADEERGDYVLTGSDRPADQAAARGQQDIFGAAPEPTKQAESTKEEAPAVTEEYTPEQRKQAEGHANEVGGEIVWQRGDNALIRGYSLLTGDPVYVATVGANRAKVDIESFTGKQVPDDVKQEMIAVKKRLEDEAAEKHRTAPFIQFQDGIAMSKDIPEQLAGVIKEWKSLLKLDVPIYVSTIDDARENRNNFTGPHRRIGSGTLDANELGSMRMMPDFSYYILFDKSTSPTKMLETIAHEMGHVHQRLFYERASREEKEALRDAHKKWLDSQQGKTAREMITSMRARVTGRAARGRDDMQASELSSYWRSFGEWYADQTARWALSAARPVTIVEKYFKRLGIQLRRFFQQLQARKYLPNETFAQYIEKATGGPAAIEPTAPGIGAAVMGERMMNAANRFRKAAMNQFKLTQEQADAAMGKLIKEKVLTLDPVTGQFELKDGRFWDREVMLRAAEAQQGVKLMNIPEKKKLPPGRSPELAEAAQQLQRGEITAQKFDELVNRYRPIPVYFAPLQPATSEQVYNALDSAKRDKIDPKIPAGYPVGLRLDIPAFNRAGVFVVSIHEKRTPSSPGKVIGYSSAASIKNVTFGLGNQREALKIAAGSAKDAIQTMEGTFVPITADQAYQMADDAILSGDWVQVGFDPTRHAYFFDRSSTMPVVAADEVIQIGNMILAKGVTYGRKEDFLYDVTGRPAAPEPSLMTREGELIVGREAVREYQIKEYAALRKKLAGVAKKVAEGEVDIDVQRNTTEMMQKSRELQSAIKASKPRVDTPEAFLAKALQEYDKGNIDKDVLDVIQAAYGKQPELLDGLLLSVRKGAGEAVGSFDPMRRIVYLYKSTSGTYEPRTIRHELSHALEQMMTPEQRMVVVQAWGKALARAIKQNPDELHQRYFDAILKFLDNPSQRTLNNAQMLLPGYEMYQFINPSEYWAVNAERLMASQLGTAWDRFKRAVQQLFEGLKKVLGFDNQYDVHRVFGQVMKGSKERITRETLVDIVMSSVGDGSQFVTLNNIEPAKNLKEKYNRPNTPMLDAAPITTFVTKQFKNGKEYFKEAAANPSMVGNDVINGLIAMRNQNIWYGSGLEARDFAQYNGALKTSNGFATASVALDNAIRGGNIGTEVIFRGGIEFNEKARNFVAVERDMGMRGVYEAEKALKDRIGDQLGTDTIQGYLEAKRSISIMTELYTREAALDAAKARRDLLQSMGAEPDEIAIAKEAVEQAEQEVASIKKAASSVNMSEEEMYEFAALEEEYPELRTIMDNWTAINQNLLKFWRQVGLLSQGRYETLAAIKDYVPWYRIMDDEKDLHDQSEIQSTTRKMTNIGREKLFKRGRPIAVVDFRATQGQTDFKIQPSSVVQVEVNGKQVDPSLVTTTPEGDVRLDLELNENDLVVFKTNREIQNIIDNMTRNVMRMTMNGLRQFAANRIVLEYATRNEKGKVMTYPSVDRPKGRFNWIVNGKKVVVEISDPLVAEAIYGMDNINLRMWAPLAAVANLTRRSITLSGAFQIKQVFKDAPTAALVTGVKNPLALIGGVWKGFLTSLTNTDPVVDILKAAGIGGFHSPARTPEAEIKRRLGIMNGNVFDFVIKGLDHIGDSSDMAQRVATYKRVLKETGDETQALYQAANVINFLHHGSAGYAQAMVKVVPFMGAYLNSSDVLIRALAGSGLKGVSRKKALLRLGVTTGLLTGATLLYCMLAGADPEYDELDDQTKLRNVMIPGTKIMMPMNTSAAFIFKAIPELIYNTVTREGTENELDRRRVRKALADAARDMLLGPEPVPAGVKPVLEVLLDRNFYTGRTVIPEGLKDVAAAEQYTASTSELGKALSALMSIPGTDDKRMLSPIEADHLVRGIFGSAGAMAQWASNSIGVIAETRPEPTARETPVIGGFLREDIPRGREDLFYDFKKEVFEKYKTWNKMIDREDFDAADAYLDKHGDIVGMYQYINRTEDELSDINKEIRRVGESRSKDLSPKERRQEMDELRRIKLDILEPVKELRREIFR
jgi:hypothetical protein